MKSNDGGLPEMIFASVTSNIFAIRSVRDQANQAQEFYLAKLQCL